MPQTELAIIGPQRICGDVRNDHLLCAVSGRPARTCAGADDGAIDCLRIGFWQAGRCAVPELVCFRVQQKDRRERAAVQFFDESAQGMEDEGASFPLGNHFEKPFLAGQQQLGPLALGDVRRAAYELHQILGRIQDRMAGRVDVFDRPVRKKDSEFHLVI